jgi:hypothetical protein
MSQKRTGHSLSKAVVKPEAVCGDFQPIVAKVLTKRGKHRAEGTNIHIIRFAGFVTGWVFADRPDEVSFQD